MPITTISINNLHYMVIKINTITGIINISNSRSHIRRIPLQGINNI